MFTAHAIEFKILWVEKNSRIKKEKDNNYNTIRTLLDCRGQMQIVHN